MGRNQAEHQLPPLRELAEELEGLRTALLAAARKQGVTSPDQSLAVARLVPGMSPEQWHAFAASNNLSDWLVLQLGSTSCANLRDLQQVVEEMARQRDTDSLTGLANRRAFTRRLETELERSLRVKNEVSLIVLDLDHFKKVNDTYGHPCGDTVLQELAKLLLHSVRAYDVAARLGGEEFALLLPGANLYKAQALAERLLATLSRTVINCQGAEPFSVTFSAGVSCCSGAAPCTADALLQQADKALYAAKNAGRNRVHAYRAEGVTPAERATLVHSNEKQFLFSGNDKASS